MLRRLTVIGSLVATSLMEVHGFKRGGAGIFAFTWNNASTNKNYARGVAVCGAGLLYNKSNLKAKKYMKHKQDYLKIRRENFKEFSEGFVYKRNVIPSLNGKIKKNNVVLVMIMKKQHYTFQKKRKKRCQK